MEEEEGDMRVEGGVYEWAELGLEEVREALENK